MPTELTDSFNLAAQISEDMLKEVFSATFSKQLPGLNKNIDGVGRLTLWFLSSNLRLIPKPISFANPIEVELDFLARLSGEYDEVRGTILIQTMITQVRVESSAGSFIAPVIDFSAKSVNSFRISGLSSDKESIWVPAITSVIKPELSRLSPFTAGPIFPDRRAQFFFNSYPNASYETGDGILAIFIWSTSGDPPGIPSSITPRRVSADRAIALVPRDQVERAIEESLQENGLKSLPKKIEGVTVTSFSIAWRDFGVGAGHFYISGRGEFLLGSVKFEAWVQLYVEHGQARVNVVRTKHDGNFIVDLADILSAGVINRALEEILPRAVGGISSGAFGNLGVFATDAVPEPQLFAAVDVSGNIDIWPSGIGVPANLVARTPPESSFPPPAYLLGHPQSREFHTSTCKYGSLIKNPTHFPTWMRAIELGYNGCWHCQTSYNVVAVGQLLVEVVTEKSPTPEVTARLVSDERRFGVAVRPATERLLEKGAWDGSTMAHKYYSADIVPGMWELSIICDDWRVTKTVEVDRAWRSNGKKYGTATLVRVKVGSAEVSLEKVPPQI